MRAGGGWRGCEAAGWDGLRRKLGWHKGSWCKRDCKAAAVAALQLARTLCPPPPRPVPPRADDLGAQDWLQAAASLARADSQPAYPAFPVPPLDGGGSHQLPSLGGSPARPPSLPMPGLPLAPPLLPPQALGLHQLQEQNFLAFMGAAWSQQAAAAAAHQQQQPKPSGSKGDAPATGGSGGATSSGRPPLGPGESPGVLAAQRRLQQLAAGAGAAAAAAMAAAHAAAGGSGGQQALDSVPEGEGFGRFRQGSLHSLQQLEPDGLQDGLASGLTPSASGRAGALLGEAARAACAAGPLPGCCRGAAGAACAA